MIFDIDVINDDGIVIFSCNGVDRDMFNRYFIESCQVSQSGGYDMALNNYKHAILRIYEAMA